MTEPMTSNVTDTALLFEGGGMRAALTSAVVAELLRERIHVDFVAGISAGSSNAVNYLSRDPARARRSFVDFADDPRFGNWLSFVRGKGQSTALECTYTPNAEPDVWQDTKAQVDACLENELTPYITTEQTVYDMDFIRAVLGEEKTSYIGYSYGTWLGSWYQRVFPQHAHRFLLDSAVDISRDGLQTTWDLQPRSRDRQFQDAMLPYVARHDEIFGLGDDPMQIRQRWEDAGGTRTQLGVIVAGSFLLPAMYDTSQYLDAGSVIAAYIRIMESEAAATDPAGQRTQIERILAEARASLPAEERDSFDRFAARGLETVGEREQLVAATQAGDAVTFEGAFSAIRCQDGQWNTSQGYWTSWVWRPSAACTMRSSSAEFTRLPLCARATVPSSAVAPRVGWALAHLFTPVVE